MIVVIDYGMGNIGSLLNIIKKVGGKAIASSKVEDLEKADLLILPGVGHFDRGMKNLEELGLIPVLNRLVVEQKKPFLGICLGMQLLTERSDEGNRPGLGWIKGKTKKFHFDDKNLRVPHMGWNEAHISESHPDRKIFSGLNEIGSDRPNEGRMDDSRFYFVHSYFVECENKQAVLSTTQYGQTFDSAIAIDNILGVQFHPEKSHKFGMRFFQNLLKARSLT